VLRLYWRAAVWVALATLLTTVVARTFLDPPADVSVLLLVGGPARRIADTLARTPPSERREQARTIERELGYGLKLEPAVGLQALRSEWRADSLFVIAHGPDTPGQIRLGPLPTGRIASLPSVMLLAVLVSLAVAWLATRAVWRRIGSLEAVATRMGQGDFAARAQTADGELLDAIGLSLNRLADRIGQLLSDERDLLRTVAHEVRAPISRMRFRVEAIQSRGSGAPDAHSEGLVADLEQVDSLFEELLTYVAFDEFDYERPALQTTSIGLMSAVRDVVEEVTATAAGLSVSVQGSESATIVANRKLFDRAVTNLLLNAMAYGEGKIAVYVREFEQECVVDVQDSGPGIPELDRPKVVKPFVRLATKKTRGTGLGLAIVTRIMALHGGRLHIVDAPSGGASIQLVWTSAVPRPRRHWLLRLVGER
jgi:two-component system sensor histidine kinase RstB